jgi:hypothetical protein
MDLQITQAIHPHATIHYKAPNNYLLQSSVLINYFRRWPYQSFQMAMFQRDTELIRTPEKEKLNQTQSSTPQIPNSDIGDFPEGGAEAWLTVLGSSACLFVSFGWVNCVGIFQQYYQTHQLSEYSASQIAWIPSLQSKCSVCPIILDFCIEFLLIFHAPSILHGVRWHIRG